MPKDNRADSLFNWTSSLLLVVIGSFMFFILVLGMYILFVRNRTDPSVWIGFIGTIISGLFSGGLTLSGVYYTIKRNDKQIERHRKEEYISLLPVKLRKLDTVYYELLIIIEEQSVFDKFMRETNFKNYEIALTRLVSYSKNKLIEFTPIVNQTVDINKNLDRLH